MTVKSVFYNQERFSIRAGWRILIFIISMSVFGFATLTLAKAVLAYVPTFDMQNVRMFFAYLGITLATWFTLRFVDRRPFVSVGLAVNKNSFKELGQGTVLGFGMMSLIFVAEYSTGMVYIEFFDVTGTAFLQTCAFSVFTYTVVGYGEELLFRGYILQAFAEGTNKIIAMLTISILFGFAHASNPNVTPFSIANIVLAGIWLTVAYYKTNALWLPIGLHFSWNFTQGFIFSYPVSGTTSLHEQIGTAIQSGPDWITGGTFGPEGGALATIIIAAGTAFIYYSPWIKESEQTWKFENWLASKKIQQQEISEPLQAGELQ